MMRRQASTSGQSACTTSSWQCASALLAGLYLTLASGCASLRLSPSPSDRDKITKEAPLPAPGKNPYRVSQFVFLADFELKMDQPLFRELQDLPDQIYKELQLPSSSTLIQVHLFEDRPGYERFMQSRYPELPKRRAFFVAQPHSVGNGEDLLVYTFWGERIRDDLRHELTHALLHSVLKDVPLWLDEGLAEYFERPPEAQGVNANHLEQLLLNGSGPVKADLAHLEQLTQVQQMTPAEYRESWAWVHLMLRGKPEAKAVLAAYLQQLRTNPNPGSLEPRLAKVFPDLDDALHKHLAKLEIDRHASPTVRR
jgi:hypothetical protein